jgi:hypothetical protein
LQIASDIGVKESATGVEDGKGEFTRVLLLASRKIGKDATDEYRGP